ncbi:epoxide hydrolase 3 [Aspergillus lentulus]|uniref:AB hydrolase-1 domain-containing protein n=1 Tax=Aspergillus lentulus TaxID=293939 RepID=A0AAN5YX51_ASPLE|nr:epoxide hydrolase 3 [Aspergillus lentulus]KAF4161375.1 hypothetical protein CNMCM6069_005218 [Aspergillus lentulus]KAF4169902.1 hypothetical protein CNMCM6936_006138 [Aspergillus lentulus]KAF4183135.1 hypothetical protein CNMCM8060_005162 [Aspergillus lentulus]KAF4190487.1 hypothetical protein CNMCM7927_003457 [Aspergillus lentulus]KAF4199450.1 hypothetical protein CNMCM8694_005123 [Aspergillus lentulus]
MAGRLANCFKSAVVFAYGFLTLILYGLQAVKLGLFFKRPSEKENLELQLARDRFWNLSKECFGLSHHILTLRSGFKFHYLCNDSPENSAVSQKSLAIFIHGFPDSWAVWRYIVSSSSLQSAATLVVVDLPGYGGSDTLDKYSATNVLESLTEFIIAIRAKYGIDTETGNNQRRTIIVGHDWGCVISTRLAAEAPQLADRFVVTNGPVPGLAAANIRRLLSSSSKMFKTSIRSPIRSRSTLIKAVRSLWPVFRQLKRSGYIFVMQLPMSFVKYFGSGGNFSFLKAVHQTSHGDVDFTTRDAAECMASTMGPSTEECKTRTAAGDEYPVSVKEERALSNFQHMVGYYRDGAALGRWCKSIQTIADLHSIAGGNELRRIGSGAGLFDDGPTGALKASSTILWGKADVALDPQICLDGISDYLVYNSEVVMLPRSRHFTPLERESRVALEKTVEWAVKGEREDIGAVVQACYPEAAVTVRK